MNFTSARITRVHKRTHRKQLWCSAGTGPGEALSLAERTLLSVSYDNAGADPVDACAGMHLGGTSWVTTASAVPEPGRQAMLLAGGLLLGRRSRRGLEGAARRPTAAAG